MANFVKKLSAIGILMLLLLMVWVLLIKPYLSQWDSKIRSAERMQNKQAALIALIQDKELLQQQFRKISNNPGLSEVFLDKKSGALADVKLQRIIKQLVQKSGAQLIQSQLKTAKTKLKTKTRLKKTSRKPADDKSVTVKVLLQGDIRSIYSMLQQLENYRPLIVLSDMQISLPQSRYQPKKLSNTAYYRAMFNATAFIL
ncbi:MAG: hypothetical protein HOM14_19880 [Gammaproteobacteria bacterium]|nr:hypothetical protein [Gammaproteobacteria bacterium]MBT3725694.1 hypothetical protein [Gammaproteobacteria bacterium]MBT4078366.1 hypothetical protein [Gammaproteobacteria bacterium]MBT4195450.1 hypothetical protein [Gammaproteobacteria bacterium]MBT4449443.1 hypothetical protein [Gammaproteobacteria bacterium]